MKTIFKTHDTFVTLKAYEYQIAVYPGMHVMMHDKEYLVHHAVLSLEKDELVVLVKRSST